MSIDVYSLDGKFVKSLYVGPLSPGDHSFIWDGTDHQGVNMTPGIYLYRFTSPVFTETQMMVKE